MVSEGAVREILKTVIDPELGVNVVDLGLLYKIAITENGAVTLTMTLTSPGCPLAPEIASMVEAALQSLGVAEEDIAIDWTFDPPWHQGMMSAEIRAEWGLD